VSHARSRARGAALAALAVALAALAGPPSLHAEEPRPNDPLYRARGSWGQGYDDQWGLKRIGFTPQGSGTSAWDLTADATRPAIVAVVDTGLDYGHPDLPRGGLWRNPGETLNGRDDDGNGYVDDVIGWNFVDRDNDPWDHTGHGTHVAGVIAAATGNGEGIAGISAGVRIMPLKALNLVGKGPSAGIAEAVYYAVRHGARVINLSLGGERLTGVQRRAIEYAHGKGVLVVAAAGNLGRDTAGFGQAALPDILTVAASDVDDKPLRTSNWGRSVKIAAPGLDVLSLRARGTDFNLLAGDPGYRPGAGAVGPGGWYYRASGTSFAAPFVSGVAALLLARNPGLTNVQVERMLLMSADDVALPGWDQLTGAGRLNAVKALRADPDWYLLARLDALRPTREAGRTVVEVLGSVGGSDLGGYRLELGRGETPERWKPIGGVRTEVVAEGRLGVIPVGEITARGAWTVRVVAEDRKGNRRESRGTLNVN
jgi:subtilisin family serine protease